MTRSGWLESGELRVGLGCMRLWSDGAGDAAATISEAINAGITVFDTARTYDGAHREAGGNERQLAAVLQGCSPRRVVRIITKGGMRRDGAAWIPDGRARAIAADCEASVLALDGIPIDLYLIHAPDPRTPWRTSVNALAKLRDAGVVGHVGLSNVSRAQLDAALDILPVSAIEVSLSPFDDSRLRDGTVTLCEQRGIAVIAHSPLGGPRRARTLMRHPLLRSIAERHGVTPAQVALRWLLDLGDHIVVIPGARRPDVVRSMVSVQSLRLDGIEGAALRASLGSPRPVRVGHARQHAAGDVVLVAGIPGAGKTRVAAEFVARGYVRLNRDVRGGSLRQLCATLDDALAGGARNAVLDNAWLTRAVRSLVIDVARRHGISVRCIWLDITLPEAQRNVVERVLERFGALPSPDQLRRLNGHEGVLTPTSQMRALHEFEPPAEDEGFDGVERRVFVREPSAGDGVAALFVPASVLRAEGIQGVVRAQRADRHLVFDWRPDAQGDALVAEAQRLSAWVGGTVESSLCPHPAGPPVCWCRPPLPGLILQFARARRVNLSRSTLVGTSAAHRSMARVLRAQVVGL